MFTEEESERDLYRYKIVNPDKEIIWFKNDILIKIKPVLTLESGLKHKVQIIKYQNCYLILLEELEKKFYMECASIFSDVFDAIITLPDLKGEYNEIMGECK
jgi:hypothetical protein